MAKPLAWIGSGARQGLHLDIPFVTTWGGADRLSTDHPMNVGIVGVSGHPGANKAVHEAEEIIVLGSGVHPTQLGTVRPRAVFKTDWPCVIDTSWKERCAELKKEKVPLIGSYLFNDKMTRLLPAGTCMVIDGGGTALYTGFQSSYIKEGSRLICSTAISAMGSGLCEAVGACFANGGKLTTCLIGDGSLMFNMQELQTIKHYNLPIKIFVISNDGYLAIRHSQDAYLESRYCGTGEPDLSITPVRNIADCFGLPYVELEDPYDGIEVALDTPGPVITEVFTPKDQKMVRAQPGKPLSEMAYA